MPVQSYEDRTSCFIFSKFLIISVLSLIATIVIYLIFVKPFNIMRVLFGMKIQTRKDKRLTTFLVPLAERIKIKQAQTEKID